MKTLAALLLSFALAGCASTRVDSNGLCTQANARVIRYERSADGAFSFYAENLNHSTPTRAGVEYVRALGGIIVPIAAGATSGGNVGATAVSVPLLQTMMGRR